jgi:hypothetical protein
MDAHRFLVPRTIDNIETFDPVPSQPTLSDLFILRGIPGHIRSDNGPLLKARMIWMF